MKELLEQAEALSGELVRWRRHIHENLEVGADMSPIRWAAAW